MKAPGRLPVDGGEVELRDLADLLGEERAPYTPIPARLRLTSADPGLVLGMLAALPVSIGLWIGFGLIVRALLA
jgi:hypothetical protein